MIETIVGGIIAGVVVGLILHFILHRKKTNIEDRTSSVFTNGLESKKDKKTVDVKLTKDENENKIISGEVLMGKRFSTDNNDNGSLKLAASGVMTWYFFKELFNK